jgi:cobalt-zinc-cadmium efflux system outer membrane protein
LAITAVVLFPFLPPALAQPDAGADGSGGALTLEAAISAALARSPALAGSGDAQRAQEARVLQAGVLPNPQLQVELENVGGSGSRDDADQSETTFRVVQLFELGGKRRQRVRIAELGRRYTERQQDTRRIAVVAQVRERFVEALGAQERRQLAVDVERAVAEGMADVKRRAGAGTATLAERSSIEATHELSRIAVLRAERDLASARLALAATWGSAEPTFVALAGDLEKLPAVPPLEILLGRLDDTPELKRLDTDVDRRAAAAGLERARRIPDVTVGAAGRHFNDRDDVAAVFEVAVPLPIFDRRQGALTEAQHLLAMSIAERDAGLFEQRAALTRAHQRLQADLATVALLRDEAMPRSRGAVDKTVDAYKRGAAHLIEVLDARRLSRSMRDEYLDALVACHLGAIEIERLTGLPPPAEVGQ